MATGVPLDRLFTLVYKELRRLAKHYLARQRAGHTLQTSALQRGLSDSAALETNG
jgi:ECF sigma factor